MKKILALLLCSVLTLSTLAGCGGSAPAEEAPAAKEEAAEEAAPAEDAAPAEEAAASDVISDFGGTKVVVGLYVANASLPGTERVLGKVNQYFLDNWNIDVELQYINISDYQQTISMMLSSGEQMDIFCSGMAGGFSVNVANESTYNMYENDLIQTYGQDILDLIDPAFLKGGTVNGELHGLSCMRDLGVGMWTVVIAKQYLDGIDYDYTNIDTEACNPATTDEMTELFGKLHEAYPDVNVIYPWGRGYLPQKFLYDPVGNDDFGVLLDPMNSLELSNLFESDMFREYCELMYLWQQSGFISKDAATETMGGGEQVIAGTLMADTTGGKPGIVVQKETERGGMDSIAFQLGEDFVNGSQATAAAWSINSTCENPEAAMVVMNALYTDPVVTNLIMWGEEGIDYQILENGNIDFVDGMDRDNNEYYNSMYAWMLPCEYTTHVWVGDSPDLWEQTIEFNNAALKSKAIGFSWDSAEVSTEYTALFNVWDEYANGLLYGLVDPAVGIPELQSRLEAAGLDTYIAAKQAALDEWAAANGIE